MTTIKKTLTTNELQNTANALFAAWEANKNETKLQVVQMYNLIKLKKTLQEEAIKLSETVTTLAEQVGGERLPNGSLKIPDDKIDEVNEALGQLSDETIEIEYTPIQVTNEDSLPIAILEPLMEFIEVVE